MLPCLQQGQLLPSCGFGHRIQAVLASRGLLVNMRSDLENQCRGLLKAVGGILSKGTRGSLNNACAWPQPSICGCCSSYCRFWQRAAPSATQVEVLDRQV